MESDAKRVELERLASGIVEMRLFEGPVGKGPFVWKMPVHEAAELVRWWASEGAALAPSQLPLRERRLQRLRISMLVPSRVYVQGVDERGRPGVRGYDLPCEVIDALRDRLDDIARKDDSWPAES